MADTGIAAGYGAGGAGLGLERLIEQRLMHDKFEEAKRQALAEEQSRTARDLLAQQQAGQSQAHQMWAEKFAETQAADQAKDTALKQVMEFPGAKLSAAQLGAMGIAENSPLRGTAFKPLPMRLKSMAIAGATGTAGTPQQSDGQLTTMTSEAVPEDTFEVQKPYSTKLEIAQGQEAMKAKALEIQQAIATAKDDTQRQHYQNMLDVMQQRIAGAETRRNSLTPSQQMDEAGKLNSAFMKNTKGEQTILENWGRIQSGMNSLNDPNIQNRTAATKNVIDSFERMLNPGSIVRQTAFAQDVGHQSALDTLYGKFQALTQGGHGMTDDSLRSFMQQVEPIAKAARRKIDHEKTRVSALADTWNIPKEHIFAPEDDTSIDAGGGDVGTGASSPSSSGRVIDYYLVNGKLTRKTP